MFQEQKNTLNYRVKVKRVPNDVRNWNFDRVVVKSIYSKHKLTNFGNCTGSGAKMKTPMEFRYAKGTLLELQIQHVIL